MNYISLIILFSLITLGTWQVYRLQYKKDIILKLQQPPQELPNIITKSANYMRIEFDCNINSKNIIYIYAGVKGYYALVLAQTLDHRQVLVNLGITSKQKKIQINDNNTQHIIGIITPSLRTPFMFKSYDNKSNMWLGIDIVKIAQKLKLELEPCVIWVENSNISGIINNGNVTIYNHHIEYIITWFTLAFILLVYMLYKQYVKLKHNKSTRHKVK